ncbi:hypothetical protein FF38_08852 [Lucilia cuprina]|uniref:Uncharacterized protein n=1 Tax=Lucilia cuprina TaxID=7375 RepID=A0A0L0BR28_LUCCU|nr:hypothetical protein FF38_08852 [Lucilia cuprina]
MGNSIQKLDTSLMRHAHQPQIRSTLVKSPIVVTTMDSEIHAATSLAVVIAFPTLLAAEQFGGDASSVKIQNETSHAGIARRDLSKLDMWTQLTMSQKHELLQQQKVNQTHEDNHWHHVATAANTSADLSREEKQRFNDQLNFILDMRLLPHIILEQNEQAIIKLENDEFGIALTQIASEDCEENFMAQTFADKSFLSMLNLLLNYDTQTSVDPFALNVVANVTVFSIFIAICSIVLVTIYGH